MKKWQGLSYHQKEFMCLAVGTQPKVLGLSSEGQWTQMKTSFMFTNVLLKYNASLNSEFCQEPLHFHDGCDLAIAVIGYV